MGASDDDMAQEMTYQKEHWLETQTHLDQRESLLGRVEVGHTRARQREEQDGRREAEGRVGRQNQNSEKGTVTRSRIQVP